jgi:phosphoglycolate phosphatase-like HAD superfamily hydrolase
MLSTRRGSTSLLVILLLAGVSNQLVNCFVANKSSKSLGSHRRSRQQTFFLPVVDHIDHTSTTARKMYTDVKGVIFDIDGTLADSWKLGYDATLVILEKNNIPAITQEEYHYCTRYATPDRLARHAGLLPGDDQYSMTGEKMGQEFDDLYVDLVSTETAPFFPGVYNLIVSVPPHVVIGALTNAAESYAHAVLKTNCPVRRSPSDGVGAIYSRFLSIRGADTVPKPKPFPDGLFQVCKEMGLLPEQCVYVGDSPSDGLSAHAAGMPSIGVLWGSHQEESLREAPFSHICRSVEELRALLPQ